MSTPTSTPTSTPVIVAATCPRCARLLATATLPAARVARITATLAPDGAAGARVRFCPFDDLVVLVRDGRVVATEDEA